MSAIRGPCRIRNDAEERRYHGSMANLLRERGFLNLSQAHRLASLDCPAGCGCSGCEAGREEAREKRERFAKVKRAA